jgi:farnesyl diphosphate synthase
MAKSSSSARQALIAYGQELGLAFQIASDIERFSAENPTSTKPSVASLLGCDRAAAQAEALAGQAASHLDLFDEKADLLRAAAFFVVRRQA